MKAVQSSYGYNVLLSFADPQMNTGADRTESMEAAEAQTPVSVDGWINRDNAWTVTADKAYEGIKAMTASNTDKEATLVIPVEGMVCLKMAARNADDHNGHGTLTLLRSEGGTDDADFLQLKTTQTNEAWSEITADLPEGTKYIAIRNRPAQAHRSLMPYVCSSSRHPLLSMPTISSAMASRSMSSPSQT